MSADSFAIELLAELRKRDSRAQRLLRRAASRRGHDILLGIEDEEQFVPLLRLAAPSAAFNVMRLFVPVRGAWGQWLPLGRGTPRALAERLAAEYQHYWAIAAMMAEPSENSEK